MADITKYLKGVKKTGAGYTALCPAHDDQKNSLSIGTGEGKKILLHCHAGCPLENILQAAGLKTTDIFPDEPKQEKQIEAIYQYKDLTGKVVHETVRYIPKGFTQRRPDGRGGHIYSLKGIKPVLFNLPEVATAIKDGKTIFISEGEKDCINMGKLGLTATTSPMGAGKWRDHYSDFLTGAHVVILPDNDKTGKEHAERAAKSLSGKAASIKIVELPDMPEHGDITDFFKKHGKQKGLQLLEKLIDKTKEYGTKNPLFVCLDSVEVQEVKFLWRPYIPLGKLTLLQGDPGSGKTFIAANIAAAVTKGQPLPFGDMEHMQGNVIFQTAEDGLGDTIKPRMIQAGADCSKVFIINESEAGLTLIDERLEQAIKQIQPRLLIIDPLQAYLGSKTDFHRANEVRPVLAHIARLAESYNMAVILVMHLNKGTGKSIYRGLGSIDIPAAARSVLLAGSDSNNPDARAIVHIKSSLAPKGDSISYILDNNGFSWGGLSQLTAEDLLNYKVPDSENNALEEAKEFLTDTLQNEALSAKDIFIMASKAGYSKRTIERAKRELNITVKKIGFGKDSQWIWRLPKNNKNSLAFFDEIGENSGLEQRPPMATYEATFDEDGLQRPPKRPPMASFDKSIDNTIFQSKTAKEKNCSEIDALFKQVGL
jgi:putative DNA primase/helicase